MAASWPYTLISDGFWPLLIFGVAALIGIVHRTQQLGKKNVANFLPLYLALLIWNVGTTYWLSYVEEPMGIKIFSLAGPAILNAFFMTLPWLGYGFLARNLNKSQAFFGLIFLWLGYEYFHQNWELTWPWLLFGNVFAETPYLVQWYEFTGVQGGTLWVLLMAIMAYRVAEKGIVVEDWTREYSLRYFLPFMLVLIVPMLLGLLVQHEWKGTEKNILAVQPNINPYTEKFSAYGYQSQLDDFVATLQEHAAETDLALLPETALQEPNRYGFDSEGNPILSGLWENQLDLSQSVNVLQRNVVQPLQLPVLAGMSSVHMVELPYPDPYLIRPVRNSNKHGRIAYNAALFLEGDRIQSYHKSKLVPGVEHTPYAWIFSNFKDLALDMGGTTGSLGTQEKRAVFETASGIKAAPVICYESVFGEFVSNYVREGANVITVITNDGWWQESAGHQQHFAYAKLRAIETRRDVVRSANTGISTHINQLGETVKRLEYNTKGALLAKVKLNEEQTFYTRFGDYMGRNALFLAGLLLALGLVRNVKKNSPIG